VTPDLQQRLQDSLGSNYTLQRELGGGGMSRVFLAEDRQLGRRVVVKVLNPEVGSGLSGERFAREIRFAAQLQDPRIVPLLQAGHVDDLPFYTMPFVEGESLRSRLARGPLSLDEALGVLRDVALALEYAHARGVVHRDIKPENILLSGRTAVVADFGIAKAINAAGATDGAEAARETLTGLGIILGTPAYMAPEQAAGDPIDAQADLYAWGVIAYELLAGAHPFARHTTAQAILAAHLAEAPVPLAALRPGLPATLTALVDDCLAKDAARRPPDAAAVVAQLDAVAAAAGRRGVRLTARVALPAVAVLLLLAGGGGWLRVRSQHQHWAREQAVAEAARLVDADHPLAGYLTLLRAARYAPDDSGITRALAQTTHDITVVSSPPGAPVAIQDYLTPDSAWSPLGATPIAHVRVPARYLRWRVGDVVTAPLFDDTLRIALDSAHAAPPGMVPVPAGAWGNMIAFVGWVGPYHLPAFHIDRFEVTNREWQAFVDSGGYRQAQWWREEFREGGRAIARDSAMARFTDRTGRPGPSTWEGGHYPDGQGDHPVSGISWYEAAAYAAYAGKSLPAFAQWYQAAPPEVARYIVRLSNLGRSAPAPVGSFKGVGPWGTYDMAGNVREWSANGFVDGRRFILGGAWGSPTYLYDDPEALSPFDRSPENGVRCVKNLGPVPDDALRPVRPYERDFATYKPATDAVFNAYRLMYRYDTTALEPRAEGTVSDGSDYREEKVSYNAAYRGERLAAYLFLPKHVTAPYQTVVFFPSANVLPIRDSRDLGDTEFIDFVVQSGRAVLYPVWQDTYERRLRHVRPGEAEGFDVIIERSKDLGRSLDYLATRRDIATGKIAYLGVSMGAAEGVIYTTLEQQRLEAALFLDGGFFLNPQPAGVDQADFAPRLRIPVLMVNGRYDFSFSPERAQNPLFRMLGTPAAEREHVMLESPHGVNSRRTEMMAAVLRWLDRWLGKVE
jgi:eukaryotic-like serine/threonine-protein kinase